MTDKQMTDKQMTIGDMINILEGFDKDTPVLVTHHYSGVLFYKIESLEICKINGENYLFISPDDKSEKMYRLEDILR